MSCHPHNKFVDDETIKKKVPFGDRSIVFLLHYDNESCIYILSTYAISQKSLGNMSTIIK